MVVALQKDWATIQQKKATNPAQGKPRDVPGKVLSFAILRAMGYRRHFAKLRTSSAPSTGPSARRRPPLSSVSEASAVASVVPSLNRPPDQPCDPGPRNGGEGPQTTSFVGLSDKEEARSTRDRRTQGMRMHERGLSDYTLRSEKITGTILGSRSEATQE